MIKPLRILIADDHAVVRRGLRALLEAEPSWKVCGEAVTGPEAVSKAKELSPDIVILDVTMPGLNGLDAAPLILEASPKSLILILTMHSNDEIIGRALTCGARGIVLKSDAERDLVAAIRTVLSGKPFFTSFVADRLVENFMENGTPPDRRAWPENRLSSRERQVIQLLAEGKTNKEAGSILGISTRTVESHRAKVIRKLGCRSFSDLLRYAIRSKLVEG